MKKGFTLIELLVVISIIGLLSSIALAALNQARAKAKDANLQTIRDSMGKEAELGRLSDGTFMSGICSSNAVGGLHKLIVAANLLVPAGGDVNCVQKPDTTWGLDFGLNQNVGGSYVCIDSTGRRSNYDSRDIFYNSSNDTLSDVSCDSDQDF